MFHRNNDISEATGQTAEFAEQHNEKEEIGGKRIWFDATVLSISQLTPTVTGLSLQLVPDLSKSFQNVNKHSSKPEASFRFVNSSTTSKPFQFSFQPGQWIDFYIPTIDKIGGYSITSLPSRLPTIHLAVKSSQHPPAKWVTKDAKVGDLVKVRVGGDFILDTCHFDCNDDGRRSCSRDKVATPKSVNAKAGKVASPQIEMSSSASATAPRFLFIAGGVGINPIHSMMCHLHENLMEKKIKRNKSNSDKIFGAKAALLYSVSTKEEVIFQKNLESMSLAFPGNFRIHYTATQDPNEVEFNGADWHSAMWNHGRISVDMIGQAVDWLWDEENLNRDLAGVYICGPPGMVEDMTHICCHEFSVPKSCIHFEKWW